MKIKVGTRFRACEGPAKGQYFTITEIGAKFIKYRSDKSGVIYSYRREDFGKFLERQNTYWIDRKKKYIREKEKLRKADM